MFERILAIAKKEFRQIRRDVRTLALLFVFPLFLLVIIGYAISFDVRNIKIAIYDQDKSEETRKFAEMLMSSANFNVADYLPDENRINEYLDKKIVQCVIVFPYDFSRKLNSGENVKLQFLIDGVDGNTAVIIMNYVTAATRFFSQRFVMELAANHPPNSPQGENPGNYFPINLEARFWYNPDLNTTLFLVPGLIAMILVLTGVILTSLSIVREKELGTMEQLRVSPLTPSELILGKTVPYTILALLVAGFILTASHILFGVQVKGSFVWLFVSTLIYLMCALGLGIFISTIATSQQVAFQISALATMLPTFILSGFVFPIESMPKVIQLLTNLTPAKFYLVTLRSILIKGTGLESFWEQWVYMGIFAGVVMGIAGIRLTTETQRRRG
jgi:ABC-2 type transport system permease protein